MIQTAPRSRRVEKVTPFVCVNCRPPGAETVLVCRVYIVFYVFIFIFCFFLTISPAEPVAPTPRVGGPRRVSTTSRPAAGRAPHRTWSRGRSIDEVREGGGATRARSRDHYRSARVSVNPRPPDNTAEFPGSRARRDDVYITRARAHVIVIIIIITTRPRVYDAR